MEGKRRREEAEIKAAGGRKRDGEGGCDDGGSRNLEMLQTNRDHCRAICHTADVKSLTMTLFFAAH